MSPKGSRGRLSILIFHRVLREPDPLAPDEPDAAAFETRMRWVRDWFNVLPLAHAVDMLYQGALPARALSITFDDGYSDNEELAAPILAGLGMTATFFVSSGYIRRCRDVERPSDRSDSRLRVDAAGCQCRRHGRHRAGEPWPKDDGRSLRCLAGSSISSPRTAKRQ
jgi:hypothetical protein